MDEVTIDTNQQAKIGSDKSYTYYSVTLPDEIQDLFGLNEGSAVVTSLEHSSVKGEEYRYLEITWPPADEETEADSREYDIRDDDGTLHVRIKPNLTRENKDSPFNQIEEGDSLFVELNELDPAIRVFQPEDATLRNKELGLEGTWPSFKQIVGGMLGGLFKDSRYTDLSKSTPYKGQEFELIPFDVQSDVFTQGDSVSGNYAPSIDSFQEVRNQGRIPQRRVRKLVIKWSPEAVLNYYDDDWTGGDATGSDQEVIYTCYLVNETKVILPCIGVFEISTVTEYGENHTWLTFSPSGSRSHQRQIDDNWYSRYYENTGDEDAITVYIPSNSQ
jgi:hypothetical protein